MKKEPGVPADGRCYMCSKERPAVAVSYADPFCSTVCCKAYYDGEPSKRPRVKVKVEDLIVEEFQSV